MTEAAERVLQPAVPLRRRPCTRVGRARSQVFRVSYLAGSKTLAQLFTRWIFQASLFIVF